jgi:SAM-dependent methyltransferase
MSATHGAVSETSTGRPAFTLFEGYAVSTVLASLEMDGLLDELADRGLSSTVIQQRDPDAAALLRATLRYLAQRGVVAAGTDDGFTLTEYGRAVVRDKGYLVWLVGGYGGALRHVGEMVAGGARYGTDYVRDGRWVAGGAALLGKVDVVPHAMRLLAGVDFRRVLDLGCGNARFLIAVCQRFGSDGVGVDLSPEACADAEKEVAAAGLSGRIQVVRGDAGDLDAVPDMHRLDLVVTFFLLHEILAQGRDRLVAYLRDLATRLPSGAHLLIAEVEPPSGGAAEQRFTPEFTYVHALMRQVLLTRDGWSDALIEAGFEVSAAIYDDMPGGLLLLCRRP